MPEIDQNKTYKVLAKGLRCLTCECRYHISYSATRERARPCLHFDRSFSYLPVSLAHLTANRIKLVGPLDLTQPVDSVLDELFSLWS